MYLSSLMAFSSTSLNSFHSMDGWITLWLSIYLLKDALAAPFLPCPLVLSLDAAFSVCFFESSSLLTVAFIYLFFLR